MNLRTFLCSPGPAISLSFLLGFGKGRAGAAQSELSEMVSRMARIGSCSSPSFSPDGETIAFGRIAISAGSNPGPIELLRERDDAELESLEASPGGELVALVWNVGGRSELELLDL